MPPSGYGELYLEICPMGVSNCAILLSHAENTQNGKWFIYRSTAEIDIMDQGPLKGMGVATRWFKEQYRSLITHYCYTFARPANMLCDADWPVAVVHFLDAMGLVTDAKMGEW